jgi:hypothetical protein
MILVFDKHWGQLHGLGVRKLKYDLSLPNDQVPTAASKFGHRPDSKHACQSIQ